MMPGQVTSIAKEAHLAIEVRMIFELGRFSSALIYVRVLAVTIRNDARRWPTTFAMCSDIAGPQSAHKFEAGLLDTFVISEMIFKVLFAGCSRVL